MRIDTEAFGGKSKPPPARYVLLAFPTGDLETKRAHFPLFDTSRAALSPAMPLPMIKTSDLIMSISIFAINFVLIKRLLISVFEMLSKPKGFTLTTTLGASLGEPPSVQAKGKPFLLTLVLAHGRGP